MSFKEKALTAMEGLKSNASNIVVAAIEDCQKVIQGIPETSSWIPVTERLPEVNGRYLCNVKSFAFPGSFYQAILYYDKYGFREGNIYTDDVTHWMPLPELPKEVPHGKQAKADTLLP